MRAATTSALVICIGLAGLATGQTLTAQADYSDSYNGRQLLWKTARYVEPARSGGGTIDIQFGLARPEGYDPQATTKYPLVLYLHGAGARGSNLSSVLNRQTAREFAWHGQGDGPYAAFVMAPQVPSGQMWADSHWSNGTYVQSDATYTDSMYLTDQLLKALSDPDTALPLEGVLGIDVADVDVKRIYVVGDSMGAVGTWDIVGRHPGLFAAAISSAGTGPGNRVAEILETPFWAIHGTIDSLVPNHLPSTQDPDGAGSLGMLGLIDPTFDNTASTDLVTLDDFRTADDDPTPDDRLIYTEFPSNYNHATVATQWTTLTSGTKEWLFAHEVIRGEAQEPSPPDEGLFVAPDAVLNWLAGEGAIAHTVYFGTDEAAVANATEGIPAGDTAFDPGPLEPGATYYWRVDEFDGTETHEGPVWSFTVTPEGSGGLKAEYYSGVAEPAGEPVVRRTDPQIDFKWDQEPPDPAVDRTLFAARWRGEIQIPVDDTYTFILRSNDGSRLYIDDRLIIEDWGQHAPRDSEGEIELTAGAHSVFVEYMQQGNNAGVQWLWKSPRIERQIVPSVTLSPVVRARLVAPAVGGADVSQALRLLWEAAGPGMLHDVYFGADAATVQAADPNTEGIYLGRQAETSILVEGLDLGATYYWRVDETDSDGPVQGPVWDFTTADFVVIDDVENYTAQPGEEVFTAWDGGYLGNGTGSTVGYVETPYVERQIVRSGRQSLPMQFDNDGQFADAQGLPVDATYSEISQAFEPARDWTQVDGRDLISLGIAWRGLATNPAEPFYVAVEDSAGSVAVVMNPDAEAIQSTEWEEWWIDLAELAAKGLDPSSVAKLTIGVGDPAVVGGTGTLYLDDIRLYDAAALPPFVAVAPAESFAATGDGGSVLSIDGFGVDLMILGTTTLASASRARGNDPKNADDLELSTVASADGWCKVLFDEPVKTVFLADNGGDGRGYVQALDAEANPIGGLAEWGPDSFLTTGYMFAGEAGGCMSVHAKAVIYGVQFLPLEGDESIQMELVAAPALPLTPIRPPVRIEIAPATSFEATGDGGTVLAFNGIAVEQMVLGTTSFPNPPKHAHYPPQYADDFDLSTAASGDDQPYVMIQYDQPVTTIFIAENGGNDKGYAQALDLDGTPLGDPVEFSPASFLKTAYRFVGQPGGAMVIEANVPIYGIQFSPLEGAALGIDPISAPALPAVAP